MVVMFYRKKGCRTNEIKTNNSCFSYHIDTNITFHSSVRVCCCAAERTKSDGGKLLSAIFHSVSGDLEINFLYFCFLLFIRAVNLPGISRSSSSSQTRQFLIILETYGRL